MRHRQRVLDALLHPFRRKRRPYCGWCDSVPGTIKSMRPCTCATRCEGGSCQAPDEYVGRHRSDRPAAVATNALGAVAVALALGFLALPTLLGFGMLT